MLGKETQGEIEKMAVEGATDVEHETLPKIGDGEALDEAADGGNKRDDDHQAAHDEKQISFALREDVIDQSTRDERREHGDDGQQGRQREESEQLHLVGMHEDQDLLDVAYLPFVFI